ncbi:HEPN domain-containing protein, partial [Streptomyces niveiscabiei]
MAGSDAEKIVSTRNYYAHMASKKTRKVVGFPEMASYNKKILFMLYIHLLKCLGISENIAVIHIASTEQFRGVLDF